MRKFAEALIALTGVSFSVCIGVHAAELNSLSKIYVANEDSGTVSVINAATQDVISTIDTMEMDGSKMTMFMAHNVQVAPDGKSVWLTAPVMEMGSDSGGTPAPDQVIVIDPQTDAITQRIKLEPDLHLAHVILDDVSKYAYVTAYHGNKVFKIDAKSYEVSAVYSLGSGSGPHGERYCNGKLFVAEKDGKNLAVIDTVSGSLKKVPIGGAAIQTACTSDGKYGFVSLYDTREVIRYEPATEKVTRIPLPGGSQGPAQITLSTDQRRLYVADQGVLLDRPASNRLFVLDPELAVVTDKFEVGSGAHGIAVSQDDARVYVTNSVDNTVSVLDVGSRQVLATIPVGRKPNGISAWSGNGALGDAFEEGTAVETQ